MRTKASFDLWSTEQVLLVYERYFGKLDPKNVPEKQQQGLTRNAKELTDAASTLHNAGHAQDAIKTTEAFQKLHLTIRDLRPD